MKIKLIDIIYSLTEALDLVSSPINNHHKDVTILSYYIGREMGLSDEKLEKLILSAMIHDIGVLPLTLDERYKNFEFEFSNPNRHAEIGYFITKDFLPLKDIADIIRYHHTYWYEGAGNNIEIDEENFILPNIIHVADRISITLNKKKEVLKQVPNILSKIKENTGMMFIPEVTEAFLKISNKEFIWFELLYPENFFSKLKQSDYIKKEIKNDMIFKYAELMRKMIDFRSEFTSMHSRAVAYVAYALSILSGFSHEHSQLVKIAGLIHDIGKLSIPKEVLEKKGKLTDEEFNTIKYHAYYTRKILSNIQGIGSVVEWASNHHEKLDGSGYPYHYEVNRLSTESRIIAVADIFTALAENRPYRPGISIDEIKKILVIMVGNGKLDGEVVRLAVENIEKLDKIRIKIQAESNDEWKIFEQNLKR